MVTLPSGLRYTSSIDLNGGKTMALLIKLILIVGGLYICYLGIKKQVTKNPHVNTVFIFIGIWLIAVAGYLMIPR